MYKCNACGKNSESKEGCNIVVFETRVKHYSNGTTGYETVKEKKLCNDCKNTRQKRTTIVRGLIRLDIVS